MEQLRTINGFSHLVQTLEGGALHADLSDAVHNVLTEMATFSAGPGNGKSKGSVTLTINFEQELETIRIRGKIDTKTPEFPRRPWACIGGIEEFLKMIKIGG